MNYFSFCIPKKSLLGIHYLYFTGYRNTGWYFYFLFFYFKDVFALSLLKLFQRRNMLSFLSLFLCALSFLFLIFSIYHFFEHVQLWYHKVSWYNFPWASWIYGLYFLTHFKIFHRYYFKCLFLYFMKNTITCTLEYSGLPTDTHMIFYYYNIFSFRNLFWIVYIALSSWSLIFLSAIYLSFISTCTFYISHIVGFILTSLVLASSYLAYYYLLFWAYTRES